MDENEEYFHQEQETETLTTTREFYQDTNEIGMEIYLKLRDYCHEKAIPIFRHPQGSSIFLTWFNQFPI